MWGLSFIPSQAGSLCCYETLLRQAVFHLGRKKKRIRAVGPQTVSRSVRQVVTKRVDRPRGNLIDQAAIRGRATRYQCDH